MEQLSSNTVIYCEAVVTKLIIVMSMYSRFDILRCYCLLSIPKLVPIPTITSYHQFHNSRHSDSCQTITIHQPITHVPSILSPFGPLNRTRGKSSPETWNVKNFGFEKAWVASMEESVAELEESDSSQHQPGTTPKVSNPSIHQFVSSMGDCRESCENR